MVKCLPEDLDFAHLDYDSSCLFKSISGFECPNDISRIQEFLPMPRERWISPSAALQAPAWLPSPFPTLPCPWAGLLHHRKPCLDSWHSCNASICHNNVCVGFLISKKPHLLLISPPLLSSYYLRKDRKLNLWTT